MNKKLLMAKSLFLSLCLVPQIAFAKCETAEKFLKQGEMIQAIPAFSQCAIDKNDEDAQLWLARYYQNQPDTDVKNVMKTLLFYHLAAENGNANAQVALAKLLLKMDNSEDSRGTLASYINQIKSTMETKNMGFKGEMLHPYVLLVLAAENADQKWYYPTTQKTNSEAQLLLKTYNVPADRKQELVRTGSLWKQRKMVEAAQEVLSVQEYETFMQTVYPEQGKADAFARQTAVVNLKDRVEQYLKQ